MAKSVDYLIVGQGIAGTILAENLLQAGKKVLVVDNGHQSASSLVAAGMWNPIVFRRITKSWNADKLLPAMRNCYCHLEKILDRKFFFEKPVVRLFRESGYINEWDEKSSDDRYSSFLHSEKREDIDQYVNAPLGYGTVNGSGWVDLPNLLESFKNHLISKDSFKKAEWDWNDLDLNNEGASWNGIHTKCVVNCMGFLGSENKFWKYLPMRRTKGEVLTLKISNFNVTPIVNNGNYLLPLGNGIFRAGATYDHDYSTTFPTPEGKSLLLEKIEVLTDEPLEVLDHQAGIRPTVKDRKPLVGRHPNYPQLAIFNGLGTKGVMIAPWLAKQFVAHFVNGETLHSDVDIARF